MPLIKHSLGMTSYQALTSYNLGLVPVMLKICHQIIINMIAHHPNNFKNQYFISNPHFHPTSKSKVANSELWNGSIYYSASLNKQQ